MGYMLICNIAVLQCAHEVKKQLDRVGLHNTKFLTLKSEADHNNPKVPPCVYGEWLNAPGQPTVLLYAHYGMSLIVIGCGTH